MFTNLYYIYVDLKNLKKDESESEVKSKINDKNFVSKSSLAKPIQSLIQLIFDIETMKQQMKEFEIDLNKMPLGKISSKQIKMAFSILNDLYNHIDKKDNESLIIDASNQFYTLIPHGNFWSFLLRICI
jgi:hypothetical protein